MANLPSVHSIIDINIEIVIYYTIKEQIKSKFIMPTLPLIAQVVKAKGSVILLVFFE